MKRFFGLLLAALLSLGIEARGEPVVRVVATDPPAEATLGRDETFYVRIEYNTDQPISIWARPYFQGKPLQKAKSNPSYPYTGQGHALGWFSLDAADSVDEVRIKLGGGRPFREWDALSFTVRLTGTGQPVAQRVRAEWVSALRAEEEERYRREREKRTNEPPQLGSAVLTSAFMLGMLAFGVGGFIAPFWAIRRWRGLWRIAAVVPVIVLAFVVARIIVDTARDPTSHNLWPIEIVIWGGASLAAMGLLVLLGVSSTRLNRC